MRKIFILAKTLLRGGGAINTKKKAKSKYLLPLILAFAFAVFGFSMITVTFEIYDGLASVGVQDIILPLAFGATCAVVFIFGVFYVISTMYHAKDIDMLRSLPLRPYQILGAKFTTLVIYEYIMEAFILLPVLIGFGIKSAAGVPYITYSAILLIVTPVIGLSIAAILVMVVMRFTGFAKNKQAFNFVGSILIVGLALGLNIGMQRLGGISEAQLAAIASGQSSLVSVVSNIFPGVIFAARALLASSSLAGLGNLALFLLCCAAGIALFLGIGQLVYFKGVIGITESAAKRKGVSDIGKRTQHASTTLAYMKKEIRLLVRSPIAFMNCVLMNLIWPILITVMLFTSSQIDNLQSLVPSMAPKLTIAILVGLSAFISSSNATASTAISREGKTFFVSKYIPMDMSKQLSAKVLTAFYLSAVGIVIICALSVVLGLAIGHAVIALLLSLVVSAVIAVIGVLIDSYRPKLSWMNEQQAIKQNLNVVLLMLVGIAFAALVVVPVVLIPMPLVASIIYIGAFSGISLMLLLRMVNKKAAKKLSEMDV